MHLRTRVKRSAYHDSVTLMQVAKAMLEMPGVADAAAVMGTAANREILEGAGLLTPEATAAAPDDLVLVAGACGEAEAEAALAHAVELLARGAGHGGPAAGDSRRFLSLASAHAATPGANLAVISVAGRYAAAEARAALERGLHVLLFSDNVALEDEIALKRLARERGLLCMGPDAGTAFVNGAGLGFANAVQRGPVGIVAASGTGLQGVACGLARLGTGLSQGIGVGGRDMSEAVGGEMMAAGLEALQADPETRVVVLVSKPPAPRAARRVLEQLGRNPKPAVVCFLGDGSAPALPDNAVAAHTLAEAAHLAARLAGADVPPPGGGSLIEIATEARQSIGAGRSWVSGLFAGGTFCYEAQLLLQRQLGPIRSNAPLRPDLHVSGMAELQGHTCIDLGEDEFTQGRLHPMIDPDLRNLRLAQVAADPRVGVILVDVVIGYGSHPDPAGALCGAVTAVRAARHPVAFVASVCGTEGDPQRLSRQEETLRAAGVLVAPDNATAARLAAAIVAGR